MSDDPKSTETQDDDSKPPTWRGAGGQPITVAATPAAAASGRALTLLFDDMDVSLQTPGDELTAVRCAGAAAYSTVEAPAQQVRITHDLRGFVAKDADARITLVADLGGAVQTFVYPYGTGVEEEIFRSWEHATELRPQQPYLMTLAVWAERRTPTALACAGVISLDVTMEPQAPPPPQDGGGSGGSEG